MSPEDPPHCPHCGHLATNRPALSMLAYVVQPRPRTDDGIRRFYCTGCYTGFTADEVTDEGWVAVADAESFSKSMAEMAAQATQTDFFHECDCRRCQHDTHQYPHKVELSP